MARIYTLLLFILSLLTACSESNTGTPATFSGNRMTMEYRVLVGKKLNPVEREKVQKIILMTFSEIDSIYNKWNPKSEISRFNRHAETSPFTLSPELASFLDQTAMTVTLTNGKFDPTIEPAQKLWKDFLTNHREPGLYEIEKVKNIIGWHNIQMTELQAIKRYPEIQLDLGGIAKGYAIDLITERLNQEGYPDLYVEWGGEIRTSGKHPEGRPWTICVSYMGIPDPSCALDIVELNDEAVASSGDYLQYWKTQDKTYTHIIDVRTACPLEVKRGSICSATVTAPTCLLADTLATAAMLFPNKEEAEKWLEQIRTRYPSVKYWILTRNEIPPHKFNNR